VGDPPHVGVVSIMIRSTKKHRNDTRNSRLSENYSKSERERLQRWNQEPKEESTKRLRRGRRDNRSITDTNDTNTDNTNTNRINRSWYHPMESTNGTNRWNQLMDSTGRGTTKNRRSWNQQQQANKEGRRPQRQQMEATDGRTGRLRQQMETTTGRMKMMGMTETPPATGTLDRKTSQVSPKAGLNNNQQTTLDD
jgi:hypothetical protein